MLALRAFQRMLLIAFIIRAAGQRQATTFYELPQPTQLQDVDKAVKALSFLTVNGNTLPETETIWEIALPGGAEQHKSHFPDHNCALPLRNHGWRLRKHRRYNKISQKTQLSPVLGIANKNTQTGGDKSLLNADVNKFKFNDEMFHPLRELFQKRTPKQWNLADADDSKMPRYPYAYLIRAAATPHKSSSLLSRTFPRNYKREGESMERRKFLPSISAGAMTNLADFFNDLSTNVLFSEKSQLGHAETQLLEGDHPLRNLHDNLDSDQKYSEKTAELLHAIRTYRPSQKIRSLVSRNPQGYHGSQFIDPNYMWVGLGK